MIDLTIKENAIQLHRDLWNRIADMIDNGEVTLDDISSIDSLKAKVLKQLGIDRHIISNCPACEYGAFLNDNDNIGAKPCDYCPIQWTSNVNQYMCIDKERNDDGLGLYSEFEYCDTLEDASTLARRVANLPESKVDDIMMLNLIDCE